MSREGSEDAPGSASLSAAGARTSRKTVFFFVSVVGGGEKGLSNNHTTHPTRARVIFLLIFFLIRIFFRKKTRHTRYCPGIKIRHTRVKSGYCLIES